MTPSPTRRITRALLHLVQYNWPLIMLIGSWQLWITANGYSQVVAPTPLAVTKDIITHPTVYLAASAWTLATATAGLLLGMTAGLLLAVTATMSPTASGLIAPLTLLLRTTPVVVMVPIIIRLLGPGEQAVVAMAALATFFPGYVLLASALRSPPPAARDLFAALGASQATQLRRLLLPLATSHALIALRITAPAAVFGTLLAEYLLGQHGLGHLLSTSAFLYDTPRTWGAGLTATALCLTVYTAASTLQRRVNARLQ